MKCIKLVGFLNRWAQKAGLKVTRAWRYPQNNLGLLDIVVPALLAFEDDFFFIQIGASDGIQNDPLHALILRHGLHGLCVEPLGTAFAALQRTYAAVEGVFLENSAVGATTGRTTMYAVEGFESDIHLSQKSSFDRTCLVKHRLGGRIQTIEVNMITFRDLLAKYAVSNVTLLQVDTEGLDFEIIKHALDAGITPQAIHYESVHLTKDSTVACRKMLEAKGYRFLVTEMDTLAWRVLKSGPE